MNLNNGGQANLTVVLSVGLYWLVLGACVVVPWLCHFALGWWVGLLVFFPLAALHNWLFVAKGSICLGIWFGLALLSFLGLAMLDGFFAGALASRPGTLRKEWRPVPILTHWGTGNC